MKKTLLLITNLVYLFPLYILAQSSCETAQVVAVGQHSVGLLNGTVPTPVCASNGAVPTTNNPAGLWYQFTATQSGTLTVSTNLPQNSGKDTRVHIYNGTCGSLTCLAGNDDISGNNFLSEIFFTVSNGSSYYIAFDNRWGTTNASNFVFTIAYGTTTPPTSRVTFTAQSNTDLTGSYRNCIVDMNNDFLDDLVTISNGNIKVLFQTPTGFNTVIYQTATTNFLPTWSVAAGDIDKNGFNDLVYGGGQGVAFVRANSDGSAYTLSSTSQYVFSQRSNFVDINNDGHMDAFVCHDVAPNVFYINDGNGNLTFNQGGLGDVSNGGNYGSIWFDYNNDGKVDLFIAKCKGNGDITGSLNQLFRNDGNGVFTNVSEAANLSDPIQTWSAAVGDFDNDGDMDILVGASSFTQGMHKLMRNNGNGTYTDVTANSGFHNNNTTSIEFVAYDFDNDGFLDVLGGGNKIMYGNGNLTFTPENTNINNGPIGDINNDGFLDVQIGGTIYRSNGNNNNWCKVTLKGIQSNGNGIGARVELHGPWGVQIRDVQSGVGFRHMNSLNVHFGIGTNTAIQKIVVKWPSGMIDEVFNPAINQTHHVNEGSTLSTPTIANTQRLVIYPNPTSQNLYVEETEYTNYQVVDMLGRTCLSGKLTSQGILVTNLPNGQYLLVLQNEFYQTKSTPFIKN